MQNFLKMSLLTLMMLLILPLAACQQGSSSSGIGNGLEGLGDHFDEVDANDDTSSTIVDNPLTIDVNGQFLTVLNENGQLKLEVERDFIVLSKNHPIEKVVLNVYQDGQLIYASDPLEDTEILAVVDLDASVSTEALVEAVSLINNDSAQVSLSFEEIAKNLRDAKDQNINSDILDGRAGENIKDFVRTNVHPLPTREDLKRNGERLKARQDEN